MTIAKSIFLNKNCFQNFITSLFHKASLNLRASACSCFYTNALVSMLNRVLYVSRVTRLGKFSAYRVTVYFGQFFLITEAAHIFGLHSPCSKSNASILTKKDGATFWRIFHKHILSPCLPGSRPLGRT
jgi:hypothetical protein